MKPLGFPETIEELREGGFIDLMNAAYLRNFNVELLACAYMTRYQATGELILFKDLLREIAAGEYDFLLMAHGQSLS